MQINNNNDVLKPEIELGSRVLKTERFRTFSLMCQILLLHILLNYEIEFLKKNLGM